MWRVAAVVTLLPALLSAGPPEPGHRALLVGIERYPEGLEWPRLGGPRADVAAVRRALVERAGFAEERITVLLDEQATRAAILEAFEELARDAGPDDVLLFYFAGHGSQLPDDDGDELDGLDETLLPYDVLAAGEAEPRDVRDDDLRRAIAAANEATEHVVLIFDCCSAGTNTRGEGAPTSRCVPAHRRGLGGVRPSTVARLEGSGYLEPGPSYVALSACRAHEPAYEVELPGHDAPQRRGLFTHCLLQELERGVGALSYDRLLGAVRRRVRRQRPEQTPVIEGPLRDRTVFEHGLPPRPAAYPIVEAHLRAGRANGLREGALLEVVDARAGEAVGRVRLDEVSATTSSFTWIEGAPPGSSSLVARVLDPGPSPTTLAVALEGEEPALRADLERLECLRLTGAGAADLVLRLRGEVWRAFGPGGTALPLEAGSGDPAARARLVTAVRRLARARAIEGRVLREGTLAGLVETAIERLDEDGAPLGSLRRDAGGVPVVRPGDPIGVRLTNRSPFRLYASLLVISPDGAVAVVQAPENEDDFVAPGRTFRSPALEVYVAEGSRPFYRQGLDRYRWVVTRRFHDLRALEQAPATDPTVLRGEGGADPEAAREGLAEEDGWRTCTTEVRVVVEG